MNRPDVGIDIFAPRRMDALLLKSAAESVRNDFPELAITDTPRVGKHVGDVWDGDSCADAAWRLTAGLHRGAGL